MSDHDVKHAVAVEPWPADDAVDEGPPGAAVAAVLVAQIADEPTRVAASSVDVEQRRSG